MFSVTTSPVMSNKARDLVLVFVTGIIELDTRPFVNSELDSGDALEGYSSDAMRSVTIHDFYVTAEVLSQNVLIKREPGFRAQGVWEQLGAPVSILKRGGKPLENSLPRGRYMGTQAV